MAKEDFNDDTKDAGEIGAGHLVTALYEVVPIGLNESSPSTVDPLKYQTKSKPAVKSSEMLTVKLRYKEPDENASKLIERSFIDSDASFDNASYDFRFASAVATFGMLLRNSEFTAEISIADVLNIAAKAKGNDSGGLRSEFIELVEKAIALTPEKKKSPPIPSHNDRKTTHKTPGHKKRVRGFLKLNFNCRSELARETIIQELRLREQARSYKRSIELH